MKKCYQVLFLSLMLQAAHAEVAIHGYNMSYSKNFILLDDITEKSDDSVKIHYHQVSSPLTYNCGKVGQLEYTFKFSLISVCSRILMYVKRSSHAINA